MAEPAPPEEQFVKPRHFELRVALLFSAIFVSVGFHLPYFPLWLQASGFDANQIAFVLSAPLFLRLITTPLITMLADRLPERADLLIAVVGITALLSLGYLLPPTYGFVLGLSVILHVFWTPHAPLVDSIALSGVRRFGVDYARIRKWGSIAFVSANFSGGFIIAWWSASAVPVVISAGLGLAFVVCFFAPRLGRPRRSSPLSAAALRDAPGLLTRNFVLFIAAAGIINSSHGLLFSFGSIYFRDVGIDERTIGFLYSWMVLAEIGMMLVFQRVFGPFSAPALVMIAGAGAVLRWALMPLVEPSGAGVAGFFAVQSLHAVSTVFLLLGVPKMIAETIGEERMGAAQGAAFFASGLSMGLVTLVSGGIYSALGASGFYLMAAVAAFGASLLLFISPTVQAVVATPPSRDS